MDRLTRLIEETRKRRDDARARVDESAPQSDDARRKVSEDIGRFSELDRILHEMEIVQACS